MNMANLIGQSIGRYHILEQLGEGGMATVYKAYDTRLERDVAVKIIRRGAFPTDQADLILKRFEREAKSLGRLSHPNIVKVHDYGEYEGEPYLVLEYLPSGTLKERLHQQDGKAMPWQEAIQLLLPIARALQFAHEQGIIHRDVKPSNILITLSGEPMLSDFGIAKILDNAEGMTLTGSSAAIGTPEYMAPEQWAGTVSPQSDIYSLGVVFYELITGRKPYQADTPAAILLKQATEPLPRPIQYVPNLPDDVEKVLIRALARKPEDRYPDMISFANALEGLLPKRGTPTQVSQVAKTMLAESPLPAQTFQQARTQEPIPDRRPVQPPPVTYPTSPTPIPIAPQKKKGNWWVWAIVVGGLLCLGVVGVFIVVVVSNLTSSTPTAVVQNTPVIVQNTPIPNTATPVQSSLLYYDDFSNPNSGWSTRTTADGYSDTMDYSNGGFRIYLSATMTDLISRAGVSLPADVNIDVDVTKSAGTDNNDFGVTCRMQDLDNFYFFEISSDGYAVIGKYLDNKMSYLSADAMQKVDGILSGQATNHVHAECVGDSFYLYANGYLVAQATDSSFTNGGDVGLIAGSFDQGGVDILFDNFQVNKP
jgi:serine/threonine protein kinase